MDAIELAEEKSEERRRLKVVAKRKEVRYRRVAYDPFGRYDLLGFPTEPESDRAMRYPPTDKQIAYLLDKGVPNPEHMSRERASQYIEKIIARREKGLATLNMVNALIGHGFAHDRAGSMSFDEASQHLDRLRKNRRG